MSAWQKLAEREYKMLQKKGFTLIEVLFALGILALGGTSLVALFAHNLREARRAREEIVINVIQRDVTVRNQLAAFAAVANTLLNYDECVMKR